MRGSAHTNSINLKEDGMSMEKNVMSDAVANVMTRDLLYDLPPERFQLTIAGIAGLGTAVSAVDPLTGGGVAVTVLSRTTDRIVVDVPLTDSPRILVLG